ncbi:site-specific integrase [Lacibacter sp. MH-610]|uniref:tyrosine-type recombinase/integrase n=1 Tax=Lacibacter sp. MH-610 TaxID=3020883 RepID=UPI0038924210
MVTLKLILDNRKKREDDVYPLKLRVTCNRLQKYYSTGFKYTYEKFDLVMRDNPPKQLRADRVEIEELVLKARRIMRELKTFSFSAFEKQFRNDLKPQYGIFELYEKVIKGKMESGAIGTAVNYRCSLNSLRKFSPKLDFSEVTPEFLKSFENRLVSEKKSITTIGIYMRPLRAIINEAISLQLFPKECYPFGRKKYIIPEGKNPKKAIDTVDFFKLWSYKCKKPFGYEARSKDFFILSYLCQGANIKDLLHLKYENLSDNQIQFFREKTKSSSRANPVLITIPLLDEIKEIINKWSANESKESFVFPFLNEKMTAEERFKTSMQFVHVTNKHLALIAAKLGITKKVTTYVARHQFSKAIIDGGESIEYLSECLGHSDIRVTKAYVQRFSLERKTEKAKRLIIPVSENLETFKPRFHKEKIKAFS